MQHTLIIAEAGVNHNGSIELAKQLIDAAADAGVDYVKFQTFKTENLVSRSAKMADYQKRNMSVGENSQYSMLKKLELSPQQHYELVSYCNEKGINFFSTAFDLDSVDFLASLHLGLWKIPSGEITNYPYLRKIASYKEPVILSTGMSTFDEIADAISVLIKFGVSKEQITILHCNTEYPTPMNDVNLKAMHTIGEKFSVNVGYSDHTQGIEVPIAAVALGATVVEKHFTLDCTMDGPDHKASLEPQELKAMVTAIRNIEQALGNEEKKVSTSEGRNKSVARKSIVAAKDIEKGELLTEENLTVKRPGGGISPMKWEYIIGTRAIRTFEADEQIIFNEGNE
ncbi:N-acetylneuraminate synthase [Bacteroides eggerthii]|jgi:N,N'-diacetyllegionaminate synthase|uniref:Sialic acid synthase n=1 Tax=Bacteroides eggerthii TaxID=28111 RepID=A0A380YKT7_9BACE|nr:N-acetylneuraminate synthase [Bacteroides eggerthii]EEC54160.1 N-acetylneuraminate synthase [Bacteroides eggerthii DSM 20697]QRQ48061.1 N-acetylneuraminate synthase [Bacteroides eggerthii]UWN86383.1 N-acetylneuraminate synthase [Bacteroides eggerthii]SUV28746.1 sialic acid synthase [Bacteroides eggerthii]